MLWWNEIALLKRQLQEVQNTLEKEQGKASRLAGFVGRLQAFGISPLGQAPRREFAEALISTVHALLKVEQVILLATERETLDLVPVAARGVSPQALARIRVRLGEGVLGRAALGGKAVVQNSPLASDGSVEKDFIAAPYLIIPLSS